MKKLSLCTVCMNRLTFLQQTLPVNLEENKNNPNVEFLLLNYNSGDDMEDWVKNSLGDYLASGVLKYFKTFEPRHFNSTHSKNMILKLTDSEIIGMVDADNFAGPNYAGWVEGCFETYGPYTITTTLRKDSIPFRDLGGKLCFSKKLFHSVHGFDESLIAYGMDDVDLANRLENAGGRRIFIEDEKYMRFIGHSDWERLKNFRYPNYLQDIYIYVTTPANQYNPRILYTFKDDTFSEMSYHYNDKLSSNLVLTFAGWTVDRDNGRKDGRLTRRPGNIELAYDNGSIYNYAEPEAGVLTAPHLQQRACWKLISRDDKWHNMAVLGYCECTNRLKYAENDRNAHRINEQGWGRGTVYLNFDTTNPIAVI